MRQPLISTYRFYRDGFQAMVLGRTLWKIIIIKLIILFGVVKLFFFPDLLATRYATDQERADHVLGVISGDAAGSQVNQFEVMNDKIHWRKK